MAEFFIRNNLNPGKAVKCTISFRQLINKGEEGEPVWVLELGTKEPHKDGGSILPVYEHFTTAKNLDGVVSDAVTKISEQIDWSPLVADKRPPFVKYHVPDGNIADMLSDVNVGITDLVPSAGIDIDSITMTVNGFDVTNELEIIGDPFDYSITWRPFLRIFDYE